VVVVVANTVVVVVPMTVVVVLGTVVVEVVPGVVVVVVEPGQPFGPHASQQLGTWPTHALPPPGARQERVFFRMSQ
jgi:hypothetical protein